MVAPRGREAAALRKIVRRFARTGWLGKNQRRRICYEAAGSFRFFEQMF